MKKALPGLLIFIAVLQIGGIMPFYFYFMQAFKNEVKIEITDKSDLEEIVVNQKEFNNPAVFALDGDHEFIFRGHSYDFKASEKRGNDYVFYGIADNQEDILAKVFVNDFDQKAEQGKTGKSSGAKVLKDMVKDFIVKQRQSLSVFVFEPAFQYAGTYTTSLSDGFLNALVVPPGQAGV